MLTIQQFRADYIAAIQVKRDAKVLHWAHASDRTVSEFVDTIIRKIPAHGVMGWDENRTLRTVARRNGISTVAELRAWHREATAKEAVTA